MFLVEVYKAHGSAVVEILLDGPTIPNKDKEAFREFLRTANESVVTLKEFNDGNSKFEILANLSTAKVWRTDMLDVELSHGDLGDECLAKLAQLLCSRVSNRVLLGII